MATPRIQTVSLPVKVTLLPRLSAAVVKLLAIQRIKTTAAAATKQERANPRRRLQLNAFSTAQSTTKIENETIAVSDLDNRIKAKANSIPILASQRCSGFVFPKNKKTKTLRTIILPSAFL